MILVIFHPSMKNSFRPSTLEQWNSLSSIKVGKSTLTVEFAKRIICKRDVNLSGPHLNRVRRELGCSWTGQAQAGPKTGSRITMVYIGAIFSCRSAENRSEFLGWKLNDPGLGLCLIKASVWPFFCKLCMYDQSINAFRLDGPLAGMKSIKLGNQAESVVRGHKRN